LATSKAFAGLLSFGKARFEPSLSKLGLSISR
jgi:hypothetical protein